MNRQKQSDERSLTLHREISRKLHEHPELWTIPEQNIARWKELRGSSIPAIVEWEQILKTKTKDQILALLENNSEDAIRLRSSSPFTGILTESERKKIFDYYR